MHKIQILGIGCKKHKLLEANLWEALEYLSVHVDIEQVTEVDEIVDYRISSIPALLIDGEPVFQGVAPGVEDLVHKLEQYMAEAAA